LKYHEAGYDAFITGRCFIALVNYLGDISRFSEQLFECYLKICIFIFLEDIQSACNKAMAVHESSLITPFYQKYSIATTICSLSILSSFFKISFVRFYKGYS
jgi:hypothetical protein